MSSKGGAATNAAPPSHPSYGDQVMPENSSWARPEQFDVHASIPERDPFVGWDQQFDSQYLGDASPVPDWCCDPQVQIDIQAAAGSSDVLTALGALTSQTQDINGCQVNPNRAHLQALQNLLGWTIGGYDTRPCESTKQRKDQDRLEVLLRYRQPEDPGDPPQVIMYDYLCETLFGVPMASVSQDVKVPVYLNAFGQNIPAAWVQADWEAFADRGAQRPKPVFSPNRYPYQLPQMSVRAGAHEYQRQAQHWILWYFHFPQEPVADLDNVTIDKNVCENVRLEVKSKGFSCADYIWYRNPGMSVPDMFHVQVFFMVPER